MTTTDAPALPSLIERLEASIKLHEAWDAWELGDEPGPGDMLVKDIVALQREAAAELSRLQSALEARTEEWQPIETAPADGRTILLWFRTCKEPSTGYFDCDQDFDQRPKGWLSPDCGWRCDGDYCIPVNQEDCTHWQPLPTPPAAAAAAIRKLQEQS